MVQTFFCIFIFCFECYVGDGRYWEVPTILTCKESDLTDIKEQLMILSGDETCTEGYEDIVGNVLNAFGCKWRFAFDGITEKCDDYHISFIEI